MQYNDGFIESSGLPRYIVIFILTAIAALIVYLLFFGLTAIAVYFMKKNNYKEFVPQHTDNLIYLNDASEQWHKNRKRR